MLGGREGAFPTFNYRTSCAYLLELAFLLSFSKAAITPAIGTMFANLQIRTVKPQHRKSSMITRGGIAKRRVSLVPASAVSNVPALSFMEDLFGDEFPEAFTSGHVHVEKSRKSFLDLPTELLAVVCDHLSKMDVKRLRLSNKQMALKVDLRLDRVYISPNNANLNCLQRILEHPRYRHCVREIVWDDAQLEEYRTLDNFRSAVEIDERKTMRGVERRLDQAMDDFPDESVEYHSLDDDDFFSDDGRLTDVAKGILLEHDDQFSRDIIARNAAVMGMEESYMLYQRLCHEEQDLMKRQADVKAFHHALVGLPNLRCITLTTEVWRPWNLYPNYDTPFYRSLPPGFRKPTIWPWLGPRLQATSPQDAHRDDAMSMQRGDWLSSQLRAYGIIVSALLDGHRTKIEDFIIDTGNEPTGLSPQIFTSPNAELYQTIRMLRIVPLKRFHLAIHPCGAVWTPNSFLTSGFLQSTLREMPYLEHFDFKPNGNLRSRDTLAIGVGSFRLCDNLPQDLVQRLKTFSLRNMHVFEPDLLNLLTAMHDIEEVTLDHITFTGRDPRELRIRKLGRLLQSTQITIRSIFLGVYQAAIYVDYALR